MEFRLLGPLEVRRDGASVGLGGPRERAVLGALLMRANELASTGYLVDAVWERPPASPETNLRTYVAGLRRRLGPPRLLTRQGGYVLVAGPAELDVTVFEELVGTAREALASGDPAAAADAFGRALALWRGDDPLADQPVGTALRAELARLRELRLDTVERYSQLRNDLGRHEDVVDDLSRLTVQHPLREELWVQLMVALSGAGRRAEALTVFDRARKRLAEELGVDPGKRLTALHTEILREQDPPPFAVPPAQLPADLASFTGRTAELERLLASATGDDRHSTVVVNAIDGMAGVGKTGLAVHAAHRLAARFPDGQLFLDLHGHTDRLPPVTPADALDRLLRGLGVAGEQIPHGTDERAALYRIRLADKRVLILLDNAATEEQVEPLLPAAHGCLVLITSRRRLTGLDNARPLSVDVLPPADATRLFATVAGHDRVAGQPEVEEIVERCGRLPLAIQIAAARLRARPAWTPAHLAGLLRDEQHRLVELEAGSRSVTAAFRLSYQHLPAAQRHLFRHLGLHPGPDVDRRAAAALTGETPDGAGRLLEGLLDAHLLQQHVPGRYRFHDLLRDYATRLCVAEDAEPDRLAAVGRLLDYYVATLTAVTNTLYPYLAHRQPDGTADQASASSWLTDELPNLIAVTGHAAEHGWPAHAVALAALLHHHLETRAQYSPGVPLHRHAVRAARLLGDRHAELRALNDLARMCHRLGRVEEAAGYYQLVLDTSAELGDRDPAAAALIGLATMHRHRGRHSDAATCYQQALDIVTETGEHVVEVDARLGLGHVHRITGQLERALAEYRRALDLARDTANLKGELLGLTATGHLHALTGDLDSAARCFRQAVEIAGRTGDRHGDLDARFGLGHVHQLLGDYAAAGALMRETVDIAREVGARLWEVNASIGSGRVAALTGAHRRAREYYRHALRIATEIGDRNGRFEAHLGLGDSLHATGETADAVADHEQALALAEELDQPHDAARAHEGIAAALAELGAVERAREHLTKALTIYSGLKVPEADTVLAKLTKLSG